MNAEQATEAAIAALEDGGKAGNAPKLTADDAKPGTQGRRRAARRVPL